MNNRLVRLLATSLVSALALGVTAPSALAQAPEPAQARDIAAPEITVPESVTVPTALQPWIGWALGSDVERLTCTRIGSAHECGWPMRLTLDVRADGGHFTLEVWRDSAGSVALPGGDGLWPLEVTVDGDLAVVTGTSRPATRVPAGAHRLAGRLPWSEVPQVLRVPAEVALVTLQRDGVAVTAPRRDADGRVWIAATGGGEERAETDTVRVSVYRKLTDGVPLEIVTRLRLNVSGRARDVDLGAVLIPGTRATAVQSALPARLDPKGMLRVYVRPGTHEIAVHSVLATASDGVDVPTLAGGIFDAEEVWVWQPAALVRSVDLEGLVPVDASRTSLPEDWHGATTFLAEPGKRLTFRTLRVGEPEPAPNRVRLVRTARLDLDGVGYTIEDRLLGELHQGWRLDYGEIGELGRVATSAGGEALLITTNAQTGRPGVELRQATLGLEAEVRVEDARSTLPAVGWDHDVEELAVVLHLPPGWELLGAAGADEVPGTWLASWTLFELFLLLLVALGMGRLFGWPWALVAGAAMVLVHGEHDAPQAAWFSVLGAVALLGVLRPALDTTGWIRRGALAWLSVSVVSLVVILFPYAAEQVRWALHPQVEETWHHGGSGGFGGDFKMEAPGMDDALMATDVEEIEQQVQAPQSNRYFYSQSESEPNLARKGGQAKRKIQQVDPNAVVQMGPGVPTWQWRTWQVRWSGPVDASQSLELYLLSPGWHALVRVLRVLLLLAMLAVVLLPGRLGVGSGRGSFDPIAWVRKLARAGTKGAGTTAAAMLLALGASSLPTAPAQAQVVPRSDVLGQLHDRVLAGANCEGPCAVASEASLRAEGDALVVTAEVHVQRPAGWRVPGPLADYRVVTVTVDGAATQALRRDGAGFAYVRLEPGRHQVVVTGLLPPSSTATLQLGEQDWRPRRVLFEGVGWTIDGLDPNGVPDGSVQLTRSQASDDRAPAGEASASTDETTLPPWYRVQRRLTLAMPWQVETLVVRTDAARPALVKVPLLEGEVVLTEGVRVEDGHALVPLSRDSKTASFASELAVSERVLLKAPVGTDWTESWEVACSRIWRCAFEGIAPVRRVGDDGVVAPRWLPWPGEEVTISVGKPAGTVGASSAVTGVSYTATPGKRLLEGTLALTVRASQGGWQRVTLPEGAALRELTIDGARRTARLEERVLQVPIAPGEQAVVVSWQQPWERGLADRVPTVDVGSPAANVEVRLEVGGERWLLWAWGPDWGPSVLFWSHLAALLLLALVLGQLPGLPMKTYEWFLLVIGLAPLPFPMVLFVVGWFAVMARRAAAPSNARWSFNLVQLGLVGATVVTLSILYGAVHSNLLFPVDMQVAGADSSNRVLRWYVDRIDGVTPEVALVSTPLLVWRAVMLLWALWLVTRLFRWLRWGWEAFSEGGLWRSAPPRVQLPTPTPPPVPPPVPGPPPVDGA